MQKSSEEYRLSGQVRNFSYGVNAHMQWHDAFAVYN